MVTRIWLALAVLCAGTARGAGPSYSADGIVNASNFTPGPFAPNSVISVFGTGLARSTHALVDADLVPCPASLSGRCLPVEMNYVRVYVQDQPVPLLFVSATQVNFLISSTETAGPVKVRVVDRRHLGSGDRRHPGGCGAGTVFHDRRIRHRPGREGQSR